MISLDNSIRWRGEKAMVPFKESKSGKQESPLKKKKKKKQPRQQKFGMPR